MSNSQIVYVVDDNSKIREIMVEAILTLGYRVYEFSNGESAFKAISESDEQYNIIAIFSDLI